ncbi:MAG: DUF2059 domain-containing protein [Pseudomonadota bacterium]
MKYLAIVFGLLLATPLVAQSTDEKLELARTYIESDVQQRMLDDMLSAEAMVDQMRAMAPQLTTAQIAIVSSIVSAELGVLRADMEEAMIKSAAENFSIDEMSALMTFYNSPLGSSVMVKMQPFMSTAMEEMSPAMIQMQRTVAQKVQQALSAQ